MTSPEAFYLTLVLDEVYITDGAFGWKDEVCNGFIDFSRVGESAVLDNHCSFR